jgi:UDP-N-acetylglucosamine 2-epimerase (non-hydrolysing)
MRKYLVVFGTRPEAIKLAPVLLELKKVKEFDVKVCITAQHRHLLDQVLDLFNIIPDFDLNIMKKNQDLSRLSSRLLDSLKVVIQKTKPDAVIVHGDTTTAFIAALAAFYNQVKIIHIEAGLRSYDIGQPFPEEANRKMISCLADLNFCPTLATKQNLINEGINSEIVHVTGNTVVDALLYTSNKIDNNLHLRSSLDEKFKFLDDSKCTILVTAHRRESYGEGFKSICKAIKWADSQPNLRIVFPVHPNPNVKKVIFKELSNKKNIFLLDPLDYIEFTYLMKKSFVILTDSGGVQEEAPSLGKKVLVLRNVTERTESLNSGISILVGTDSDKIIKELNSIINTQQYVENKKITNPFGDGNASKKIVNILNSYSY